MPSPVTKQQTQIEQNCRYSICNELSNTACKIAILATGLFSAVIAAAVLPPPLVPGALLTITLITLITLLPDSGRPIGTHHHYAPTYLEPVHHFIREAPRRVVAYTPEVVRHVQRVVHPAARETAPAPSHGTRVPVGSR